MNVNSYSSNSIYTNSTSNTMNINRHCDIYFGSSLNDYDDNQSNIPKKKKFFVESGKNAYWWLCYSWNWCRGNCWL